MSSRDIDTSKDILLQNLQTINKSDTISQFVDKCNHNFSKIVELGGGTAGIQGEQGTQGVPVKPKVPIHAWIKGSDFEYLDEYPDGKGGYIIDNIYEDLTDEKYQIGHLIILQNGHVYVLKENTNTFILTPIFIFAMQSFNTGDIIDGKSAYLHIAYADNVNGDNLVIGHELNSGSNETEVVSTFNLMRSVSNVNSNNVDEKPYMGIYSDFEETSSTNPERYTWVRVQGRDGKPGVNGSKGDKGEKGDKGDTGPAGPAGQNFTGHMYTIDLEGDMSTISLDMNRKRLYEGDYCECIAHAYYGNENVKLYTNQVFIESLSEGYDIEKDNENEIHIQYSNGNVGLITITEKGNDVAFKFTPDPNFSFPKNNIIFSIHVEADIYDENNSTTYSFTRDNVWAIKGIVSTFELEIIPQYRTIKLNEDGGREPEELSVSVYKTENGEREIFDLSENPNFKLLYKNYNVNNWTEYTGAVDTKDVSCLEFKVVKNYNTVNEEIWDYEDVWAVADGKGVHYYHADLGNTESMMVLTTGEKINISKDDEEPKFCADIRNKNGYSITFDPKFYDGSEELTVTNVGIGTNSTEIYYSDGTFERELVSETINGVNKYTLKITKVPYDVEVIPMTIIVTAETAGKEIKSDSISFNVYISTQSDVYTLVPSVSAFNTSTGKTNNTIGCNVYKNNEEIEISNLEENGLTLNYIVYHDNGKTENVYTEPLVYGKDDDSIKDEFTASDIAIEFFLIYNNKEIVRSTVPLIKDGIDGKDGDSWQYIFCRSPKYPFSETGFSYPSEWTDNNETDSNSELLGDNGVSDANWYDDHKGVSKEFKYEYQAYRKWDKEKKCWGKYGEPTLYSNYSEDGISGSGYSALLSNPIAVIPIGNNDWSTDENLSESNNNQTDSTLVYFYDNIGDISKKIKIYLPTKNNDVYDRVDHFTCDEENGIKKVIFNPIINKNNESKTFDFETNTPYKLPITIQYNIDDESDSESDNFITTIYWTLTPIKGLNDVEVFVDKRIVNTSISTNHTIKVGYYLISNNVKKFVDTYDSEYNNNKYEIKLTNDIGNLQDINSIDDWTNTSFNFICEDGEERRDYYVVLVEPDGKTIVDYVNITSVNNGVDGKDGVAPSCTKVEILGYSLSSDESDESDWVDSIDKLDNLSPGQAIYILNEYTWSDGNVTTGITVTLAGTQGVEGKSRVLFYLGSFEEGKATLIGNIVTGYLTDERCDYYIDLNGQAWMRSGNVTEAKGSIFGNINNPNWKKSTKVGFLQAGAITADMINTASITADSALVSKIFSEDIVSKNLTVDAANITGILTIGSDSENEGVSLNGTLSSDNIGDGAITATKIEEGAITADKIAANAITAGKIDTTDLTVEHLNTKPNEDDPKGRILISDNDIEVYSISEEKMVLKITGGAFEDLSDMPSVVNKSGTTTQCQTISYYMHDEKYENLKIMTIEVPDIGYNCILDLPTINYTFYVDYSNYHKDIDKVYYIYCDIVAVEKGETCENYPSDKSFTSVISGLVINTNETIKKTFDKTATFNKNTKLKAGTTYDLYIRFKFDNWVDDHYGFLRCGATVDAQNINYSLIPDISNLQESLTCIASNGIRFAKSATEYFELNGDCNLTYKCNSGNYVFKINNSGLELLSSDNKTILTIGNTGIKISYENNYGKQGLELNGTGYYMYIDSTRYKLSRDSSGYIKLSN